MLSSQDVPVGINLAGHFVDRIVADGGGDRVALIGPAGVCGYGELAGLVNRIGNVLLELGVQSGDRVLLALSDSVEFVATWYAAQKIGAVTAEVYTFLPVKDYRYFLGYVDPVVTVVDQETVDRVREAGPDARLLVLGVTPLAGEHDFAGLVAQASPELAPIANPGPALWKFTTGSTGAPKACVHTTRAPVLSSAWYGQGVLGLRADDVVLPVPKLFFGYARDLAALFPFDVGAAGIVFPERSTVDRIFALIAEHRPTVLVNVPTMMSAMIAHPEAAHQDLSCLRLCTSAGEALPAELHRRWDEAFGVEVLDGIGSSEAYHIYLSNRPGDVRPGSVGTPVPGYRARVVDPDGAEVPDGEIGVLEVSGATVATGYHGDAEKTAHTFPAPDTVHTGDLFDRDADGVFHYRGRADDLMKVSGIWIAPSEIEHCLAGHPDVLECAVFGHNTDGLVRPWALVVLRTDTESSGLEQAMRAWVRERLSPHKVPQEIHFTERLPRTSNGKLDRKALSGGSR